MSKFAVITCTALITALCTVGLIAPADAAKPAINLSVPAHATAGTTVTLRGTLSRAASGLKVTLQTKSGSSWKSVKRKKQGTRRGFAFAVTVPSGNHSFRVVTTKTKKLARATSRVVRITGVVPAGGTEVDRARAQILADTNTYRDRAGLKPLALMPGLTSVAQKWAIWMANKNSMVHNPKLSSQVPGDWRRIGENIGMGYDIDAITAAWYASPGHKANMLGEFTKIGIGFARDSKGRPWYVQDFAKY